MQQRWWWPALLLAASVPAAQARTLGTLEFKPCTLSAPLMPTSVEAQCATLQVPENRAAPGGRRIALRIGWVPAQNDTSAEPDPVFMLAGGPGQSALDTYPQVQPAFAKINAKRHVILVDQRGTGGSNPLQCPQPDKAQSIDTPDAAAAYARSCLAQLEKKADLRFYTTGDAIADLDAVRQAIGAERIDLVGVSYGTRVAQQYAATYPRHTRAIVLDGVAPNSLVLGNEFAQNLESALDLQFARCANDKACADKLGNPRQRLNALMQTLRTQPPTVTFRDPVTGAARRETLHAGDVAGLVRMSAYMPLMTATLPLQFAEAAQGRYDTLAATTSLISGSLSDSMAMGMQLSVICAEDGSELAPDPGQDGSLLGNAIVEGLKAQCAVWPKGTRAANFRKPLSTDVPALLLSGQFDPVTPPRYGAEVAKSLPNARHLVLKGQGHNVIAVGCAPQLLGQFLDKADAKSLDTKCLDRLTDTPPFTGFYGWDP
ncbi:MAG: alpha/beta hydrolase [Pseudoxanthomonas spadix]|nr:MAG: alpha/beta hydrolase [Pseudoxanthomonas spadix]